MSQLESLLAASGEAPLLDSLSYTVPAASTAVVQRKQGCRAYPTSASTLSPNNTRTVRLRLGGNDWIDPNSVRLVYTTQNTDGNGHNLCPVCGPWGPFGLVRLMSGGVELDRIDMYNRAHELHGWRLLNIQQQAAEAVYGWSSAWTGTPHPNQGYIRDGASVTVSFKPMLSVFMAGKAIPARYLNLELECTLTANAQDWLSPVDYALVPAQASTSYALSNIQLMYDTMVLDPAVEESFFKSLLSNRRLSLPTMFQYQVIQVIPPAADSLSFNVVRSFSRLSHCWLTFVGAGAGTNLTTSFVNPTAADPNLTQTWFAHPQFRRDEDCPSIRLSIGPMNVPDPAPVNTIHEHYFMLQKALGGAVPYLDRADFGAQTFTSVFDLRKVPGDPQSSLSTRSGDLIRFDIRNITPGVAQSCIVTLWAYGIVSIAEQGISVLD